MIQLWLEGFAATGESGKAQCLGTFAASSIGDAVEQWAAQDRTGDRDRYINKEKTAYWGCRFFDNEADARRNFG